MPAPAQAIDLTAGRLSVDVGAIVRNWQALDQISPSALTGAVVKANAYGLGMREIAPALFTAGARFQFVATPEEGLLLRDLLPLAHIFVFDGLWPGAADIYAQERLMPVINSMPMLEEWLRFCLVRGEAYPAALHFDTGMNRLGFRVSDAEQVRSRLAEAGYKPQMLMSHLACADIPEHEKNRIQLALFQTVLSQFPDIPASIANSAGLMSSKAHHFQLVRPGIALYGGRAISGRTNPMAQVVTLEAPILQIREARAGETVGYGAVARLQRDSRLAILPLGYADGFFRSLGSSTARAGSKIFVRGRAAPVIGRVSMDLFAADITDLGANLPAPGEYAEIIGEHVTIDDHADAGGTIGYEVLTALKGRYTRHYVNAADSVSKAS